LASRSPPRLGARSTERSTAMVPASSTAAESTLRSAVGAGTPAPGAGPLGRDTGTIALRIRRTVGVRLEPLGRLDVVVTRFRGFIPVLALRPNRSADRRGRRHPAALPGDLIRGKDRPSRQTRNGAPAVPITTQPRQAPRRSPCAAQERPGGNALRRASGEPTASGRPPRACAPARPRRAAAGVSQRAATGRRASAGARTRTPGRPTPRSPGPARSRARDGRATVVGCHDVLDFVGSRLEG